MEKKGKIARNGQSTSDYFCKKDVSSTKQHYRRRKENFQSEFNSSNNGKQFNNSKNRNGNNFNFYDKRPVPRKSNAQDERCSAVSEYGSEATRLMEDDYELNSVFNPGSKKQNLNHLLNFHKYTKESDDYRGAFTKHGYRPSRMSSKKYQYRKEQYLQANCQFIVRDDYDYKPFTISPDTLVEWDLVVKVLISSCEEIQCPICLYPPRAAKMTKCGHIYCFSCMLHYLSLSDKTWRKCPICYESVYLNDLKSTTSKHNHTSFKVGDIITMDLMKREKGSLFVNKANEINNIVSFPNFTDVQDSSTYAKLITANKSEILKIIEKERYELDFQLAEDGFDCPESIFVHQALDILNVKQKEIEEEMLQKESSKVLQFETSQVVEEALSDIASNISTDDSEFCNESLIDEDCNLTVNDIDMTEVSSAISKYFYYYQAPNAQNVFLHSFNSKMLQLMYGSLEKSPQTIRGKIVQIECCTMNEDLRKRLKYLQHLPVSSVFEVIEIEFEHGTISRDIHDLFKDELYIRRKKRQIREREEKKREKVINEINDRQMGKMLKTPANIDICSTTQFPDCSNLNEMPALTPSPSANEQPRSKKNKSLPSFANMLTSPTGRDSQKLWPSLASNNDNKSSSGGSSFFGDDKKVVSSGSSSKASCDSINKLQALNTKLAADEYDDENSDEPECKAPAYKNSLSDALVDALQKASLSETKSTGGAGSKKKKSKKTVLFSSGMNFN